MELDDIKPGMGIVVKHDHEPVYEGDFGEVKGLGQTPEGDSIVCCAIFAQVGPFYKVSIWLSPSCIEKRLLV